MYGLNLTSKFQQDNIERKYRLLKHRKRRKEEKMGNLNILKLTDDTSSIVIVVKCFDRTPWTGCIIVNVLDTQVCV